MIQVDRDTVLVCFDRECSWGQARGIGGGGEGAPPTHQHPPPRPCAGCVRIVNLLGEPTPTLAPVLTFDFPIETVGE